MQRGVLLGAGAAVLIVGGALALRGIGHHAADGTAAQTVYQTLAMLLPGATVRHGVIDQDGLTGTLTIHDLAVSRPGAVTWTADTLALSDLHAQSIRDIVDPAAYPDGHPAWTDRRLLVGKAVARHVHATAAGAQDGDTSKGEATAESVELHRLSGRPFALAPTPQNRTMPAFAADAALAFAAEDGRLTDLALTSQAPSAGKMTVGSIDVQGYDGGKAGSAAIKTVALDATGKDGGRSLHLTLESASLDGADGAPMLQSVQSGGKAGAATFIYRTAYLAGLAMQVAGGPAIALHDMHADQTPPDADGVRQGRAVLTGMVLGLGDTPVPASAQPALDAFGLKAITADITATSHGKPGSDTSLHEDLVLHDLGTLHLDGTFANYRQPGGVSGASAGQAIAALMSTTIEHARIAWEDRSLTQRIFKVAAEQSHTTPADVRAKLAIPLLGLSVMLPDQPDAGDQVTRFLDHPNVLTVTMDPPVKISLGELASTPVLQRAHALGVRVESR